MPVFHILSEQNNAVYFFLNIVIVSLSYSSTYKYAIYWFFNCILVISMQNFFPSKVKQDMEVHGISFFLSPYYQCSAEPALFCSSNAQQEMESQIGSTFQELYIVQYITSWILNYYYQCKTCHFDNFDRKYNSNLVVLSK